VKVGKERERELRDDKCFNEEVITFQKLLRVQQDEHRKLTLVFDQMELIRGL
jgi:hypothetical protein